MYIVAALFGLLAVLLGQHYYIKKSFSDGRWNKNLDVSMWLGDKEISEGEESSITIRITNKKVMPLPAVQFKFQIGRGITLIDNENSATTDNVYVRHIFTLMSYQRITRKIRIKGSARGYYSVKSFDIIANDLMYLDNEIITVPYDISMYVLPARSDYASKLTIPFKQLVGETILNSAVYEDPFEFRGIRQYQTFDTMKKINWNASAKTGELMVNQFFDTTRQTVVILLNLERARCIYEEQLLEESIRMVRTFLEWFSSRGMAASVYTNGRDILTGEEVAIDKGAGTSHISGALRKLARIDMKKNMRSFEAVVNDYGDNKDAVYLMISSKYIADTIETYNKLKTMNSFVKWVIPCNKFSERADIDSDVSFVEVDCI